MENPGCQHLEEVSPLSPCLDRCVEILSRLVSSVLSHQERYANSEAGSIISTRITGIDWTYHFLSLFWLYFQLHSRAKGLSTYTCSHVLMLILAYCRSK